MERWVKKTSEMATFSKESSSISQLGLWGPSGVLTHGLIDFIREDHELLGQKAPATSYIFVGAPKFVFVGTAYALFFDMLLSPVI